MVFWYFGILVCANAREHHYLILLSNNQWAYHLKFPKWYVGMLVRWYVTIFYRYVHDPEDSLRYTAVLCDGSINGTNDIKTTCGASL